MKPMVKIYYQFKAAPLSDMMRTKIQGMRAKVVRNDPEMVAFEFSGNPLVTLLLLVVINSVAVPAVWWLFFHGLSQLDPIAMVIYIILGGVIACIVAFLQWCFILLDFWFVKRLEIDIHGEEVRVIDGYTRFRGIEVVETIEFKDVSRVLMKTSPRRAGPGPRPEFLLSIEVDGDTEIDVLWFKDEGAVQSVRQVLWEAMSEG